MMLLVLCSVVLVSRLQDRPVDRGEAVALVILLMLESNSFFTDMFSQQRNLHAVTILKKV